MSPFLRVVCFPLKNWGFVHFPILSSKREVYNSVPRQSVEDSPEPVKPCRVIGVFSCPFATCRKQNQDLGNIVLPILKIRKLTPQPEARVLFEVRFSKGLGEKLLGISDRYFPLQ